MNDQSAPQSTRETWLELGMNVAAPAIVLIFLSEPHRLGPAPALILALLFPIAHSGRSVLRAERPSPFSILALVSILLTGGIGLLEIDVRWFAWKEALLPTALGIAALVSAYRPRPVLHALLERMMDTSVLERTLDERNARESWNKRVAHATRYLGVIMLLSAGATAVLARWMVISPTGTTAFNEELGRYTAFSFPVLGIPSAILMGWVLHRLLGGLEKDTGMKADDLFL